MTWIKNVGLLLRMSGLAAQSTSLRRHSLLVYVLQGYLLLCSASVKADEIGYASRSELVGYWQGIEISAQFQPRVLASSPWPLQCQWFAFFEDGRYASLMKSPDSEGQCERFDAKAIAEVFEGMPASFFFKWQASGEPSKGLIFVGSREQKNHVEVWAPHIFNVDSNIRGESYLKGDLFLRLLSTRNFADTVWLRHLRQVPAQLVAPADARKVPRP